MYDNLIRASLNDYSVEHWTARAEDYSEFRRTDEYAYGTSVHDALAAHGIVGPSSRVLEVGSGPGTFVIPFAKRVAHMTAVEPAEGMIRVIQRDTAETAIANYDIISKIWQEVDTGSLRGSYDLVITSTVIWMFRDILQQIGRMEEIAGGYCCVVEGAGGSKGFEKNLWHSIMGETPYPAYAGYPIIYNILYQNGRIPQVRMIDARTVRSFDMLMNVYRIFYSLYTEVRPEVEEKIRSALQAESRSGLHERNYRAAVVWWDPKERREG
ncbi:class I SAM-dependent methyltransferase [Methanoregula sp.]|uniref:class I SAM-dependent methyltransferase n=1 Tax=Methanoregula sp. TaxID=2052170 RepID=UPI0025F4787E|nr:class I SAM-dependent methyltransferase [Methanoregula sp.]